MRKVFNSRNVAHLWAHQTQDSARNSNRSFYFDGKVIYSYGTHFPIACHWGSVILFTTREYSVTTRKHKSDVRHAIPNSKTVFNVPNVLADSPTSHLENCIAYVETIENLLGKCGRARSSWTREYLYRNVGSAAAEYNAYVLHFAIADAPAVPAIPGLATLTPKFANVRDKEARARHEEQERTREAARIKDQTEKLDRWRQGEIIYSNFRGCPVGLRIRGDVVETTLGAEVPVEHARRALAWVRNVVARGVEFVPNGKTLHIGVYSVDRIETDGTLHAGCHVILYAEIERIAPQLETV